VAFIGAGFWTIYGSAMADVIDDDELGSGQRREGSFAACGSWISKVGLALGNGASGWVLMFTGFDAKLPAQGEEALLLIRVFLSGIPICGLLVALYLVSRYVLTEQRMREIRAELEARRGTV
jgi:GPH family glycoside/pentoside/hexuronide:cation symporter